MAEEQAAGTQAPAQQFALQRIYTKDISLESPATPAIFKKQWQPQVSVDLGTKSCLLYTSPSPRDRTRSRMPSSA